MPSAHFIVLLKSILLYVLRTAYRSDVILNSIYMLFYFLFSDFSVRRLFPLPSAFIVQT